MSAVIHNLCDDILNSVRKSNLNFVCQETPYSVFLTIRKSWKKHQPVQQLNNEHKQQVPVSVSQVENNAKDQKIKHLECQLEDAKAKLNTSKHLEHELQTQLDAATLEVSRQKKETEKVISKKNDDINILKDAIKASKVDKEKLCIRLAEKEMLEKKNVEEIKKAGDAFKEQLKAKDVKMYELVKEKSGLEEKCNSLLDLLYGCNECGRFGDFCECDGDTMDEENNVELLDHDLLSLNASLTPLGHCSLLQTPSSPPPTELPVLHTPQAISTSPPPTWTPPATPPCSRCGAENYGPCPASMCFACIPPLAAAPSNTDSSSPPRTLPGTPPPLSWNHRCIQLGPGVSQ